MSASRPVRSIAVWTAVLAGVAVAGPAGAQTATNVNVLNLLAPFLGLNATPTGRQTLADNLSSALAVNAAAAANPTIAATSISDKAIFGGASLSITLANGTAAAYGPGANIGGGLPVQQAQSAGGIAPAQSYGALGQLGGAYQAAVAPNGAAVPGVATLLRNAYALTSSDLGVAKYYFANGTTNGTTVAVAPAGYTLPTANGFPSAKSSVYDLAYGVTNTGPGQNVYGGSRPVQVRPIQVIAYDPTAITGLTGNPSFPSGHTNYGFTDGILIGMLVPQDYQAAVLRASEYGNSRIALGVHYPLDIVASRAFSSYDLAQMLTGNPAYAAANLPSTFASAQPALAAYLASQAASLPCGSVAACAASNPYLTSSLATYGNATPSAGGPLTSNGQIYGARQTYGMPTMAAAAEAAPAGGPDASILLATVFGGSTSAAQAIAPNGGVSGKLSTGTINQILLNTESPALAAFYGTPLSYWSRINLYDAAGYFGNTTGALTLAAGDQVLTNVAVGSGSTLRGLGASVGTSAARNGVTVLAGGVLSPGVSGGAQGYTFTINGDYTQHAGGTLLINAANPLSGGYDKLVVNGTASLAGMLDLELPGGLGLFSGVNTLDILDATSFVGDFTGLTFDGAACTAAGNAVYTCGSGVTISERFEFGALDLQIAAVATPEPGSFALLAAPLAGLVWWRRRARA